ncbi:Cob-chelat-sub: cobaltochelatase subunit [Tepidimonas taiwanensis]|uniref:Cob-chelat-sub: cobaltochelatase subunit n=2 Tax=Tepidimonas taiwanensis TaxID=307486 RepID=A0A554XDB9_9BURK|nr:Cob-chelat-sub: cobaltochelatase subunit [Tepidimonas taiwanensis]
MHVIVLDISGSMAWGQRAARAKAYAAAIVEGARRSGAWVALLAVGGQHAQWVLRPRAARRSAVQRMQALGCGGGTPMQQAALQVEEVLCAHARHYPAAYRHVWVLTDGRVRTVPMRPLAAHEVTVVDFDDDPVPLGQARRWAAAWGARWLLAAAGCPGLAGGRDG